MTFPRASISQKYRGEWLKSELRKTGVEQRIQKKLPQKNTLTENLRALPKAYLICTRALALTSDLRIMRGLVVIDGWFDMNPDSAVSYQTMLPIGGLRKNDYTLPSIVMDMGSNHFRL